MKNIIVSREAAFAFDGRIQVLAEAPDIIINQESSVDMADEDTPEATMFGGGDFDCMLLTEAMGEDIVTDSLDCGRITSTLTLNDDFGSIN